MVSGSEFKMLGLKFRLEGLGIELFNSSQVRSALGESDDVRAA